MIGKRQFDNRTLVVSTKKRGFPKVVNMNEIIHDFSKYENTPGVWACWGIQRKEPNEWVCLNVGQSEKIGPEMRVDRKYSRGEFNNRPGIYKNYLGEVVFKFKRPNGPISTRQRVWDDIGKNYYNLIFILISDNSNEAVRLKEERDYALKYKAKYWNYAPNQDRCNQPFSVKK